MFWLSTSHLYLKKKPNRITIWKSSLLDMWHYMQVQHLNVKCLRLKFKCSPSGNFLGCTTATGTSENHASDISACEFSGNMRQYFEKVLPKKDKWNLEILALMTSWQQKLIGIPDTVFFSFFFNILCMLESIQLDRLCYFVDVMLPASTQYIICSKTILNWYPGSSSHISNMHRRQISIYVGKLNCFSDYLLR